ncbi:heat shock transcription factor, X-linked member 4 [Erethizon dorsatum]
MGNSINKDDCEGMPDPAAGEERGREVPSNPLPGLNEDSREVSERDGDHAVCQDPRSQELQQPENPNQHKANEEGSSDTVAFSFPRKLWTVVENDAFKSVCWNDDGDTVVIEVDLFQREILGQRDPERIFEADTLKSFIHQLHLYGFRQIHPHNSEAQSQGNQRMMIYYNSSFQRDKPGLLENIWRKGDLRNPACRGTCEPTLLRKPAWQWMDDPNAKKKPVATRHSPRFPKARCRKSKRAAARDQGPRGPQPTVFSGVWAMKSIAGHGLDNQPPQAPSGPSGDGTARSVTFAAPAAATVKGQGEEPSSSSAYRDHCALMTLYNTCYSVVLTALSAKTPDEHSHQEQQEGASDYKSVLCEQVMDNPNPQ